MGWSSWNTFHAEIDEATIREIADAIVSSGMRELGYVYVNLDDSWASSRDSDGNIQADPVRFPSGIKALADYVHSKGLKFGIYTSASNSTCQNKPGSSGYEIQDAAQYAAWGVDAVKDDFCYGGVPSDIQKMQDAIQQTKRPMLLEAASGGQSESWHWARSMSHLWRTGLDIHADWPSLCRIFDETAAQHPEFYAGPGHWNDPDMLEVGVPGLSESECRVHFGMWSLLAAPLIAGNDVRKMSPAIAAILTHPEVIAIDQDQLGQQGFRLARDADTEIWVRKMADGSFAVGLLNRSDVALTQQVAWHDLGMDTAPLRIRNVWDRQDLEVAADAFSAVVQPHDLVLIRVYFPETQELSILSAIALDTTTVRLHFSAIVERASVEKSENYVLGDVSILSAEMDEDSRSVVLRTSAFTVSDQMSVHLIGARRPGADAEYNLSAPVRILKRLSSLITTLKGKVSARRVAKSTGRGYIIFEANQRDSELPNAILEVSPNGKTWTPVYRFDRVPLFDEPFYIDVALDFRYLRVNPSNIRLLQRMSVFGPRK